MIELKLTGHEQRIDLVKQTLEQIRKYDMVHQCSIASMNLEILKEAKQMESQIETVYITPCCTLMIMELTTSTDTVLRPRPLPQKW